MFQNLRFQSSIHEVLTYEHFCGAVVKSAGCSLSLRVKDLSLGLRFKPTVRSIRRTMTKTVLCQGYLWAMVHKKEPHMSIACVHNSRSCVQNHTCTPMHQANKHKQINKLK